jgi:alpha-tubulin suppressor-like RCC1 family protein
MLLALHRSLYFGNITIAHAIIDRDTKDALGRFTSNTTLNPSGVIKLKDREGFSPFDVLASTISHRMLGRRGTAHVGSSQPEDFDTDSADGDSRSNPSDTFNQNPVEPSLNVEGDELFAFGSNKNLTLGFGDGDDRQYPERVTIKRPDHLFHRFHRERRDQRSITSYNLILEVPQQAEAPTPRDVSSLPTLIRCRPLIIREVALSKLHSAVLTTDPESNLYTCGFGAGGRLGTGDETTRFNFVCIEGGGLASKKIISVGLGLNHTLAIDSEGEIFSWGSNGYGQLGYGLPKPKLKDQEPIQTTPRQIFGPLKRELIIGIAASRLHSAVHTATSLFTFGKNEGQLGLVDSDARSLEIQTTPRRVGASQFSSSIRMVSAIDRATVCLLENHEVWVFANFGFAKISFPLEGLPNYFLKKGALATRHNKMPNHISKIASGGDVICAMSSMGDVFTITVQQKLERGSTTSTTNPTKIRNALAQPKRIWSLRKGHMAVRDVDVGQDGSVIICTHSGSAWRRVKRAKIKDSSSFRTSDSKLNDYKFSRVPGLTRVIAARSNAFGGYAAVRRDCDVPRTQINVDKMKLWDNLAPLLSFQDFFVALKDQERTSWPDRDTIKSFLASPDLERDMSEIFFSCIYKGDLAYNVEVCSSVSDVAIPAHRFMLAARSPILRAAFSKLRKSGLSSISDLFSIGYGEAGVIRLKFQGIDFLSILNFVLSVYTDTLIDVWYYTRLLPDLAFRFRQVRSEMMRIGSCLELRSFERSVRVMVKPTRTLHADMEQAITDLRFFDDGDAIVELADSEVMVHSVLMCQRCPFFEGLFKGRAAGEWLSSRRERVAETSGVIKIDLKHVDSAVFKLVLRHIYADTGEELFEDVVTEDIDEFLDIVMDVMSVANELMLDRLSQICQKTLGRFGESTQTGVISPN